MNINEYFDRIIIINLERRWDRWQHAMEQCAKHGLRNFERFEAHSDVKDHEGKINGNMGCTASHRGVLELICHHRWRRTLVLEDDFEIRFDDFNAQFEAMLPEVPDDWDLLYLGGHYADAPQKRMSPHVIKFNRMFTTSSYGITMNAAREMAPHICGIGPIDCLFGEFTQRLNAYIFQPRLMVQYENLSDLQHRMMNNVPCMEDPNHENMV